MTDNPCMICGELEDNKRKLDIALLRAYEKGDHTSIDLIGMMQDPNIALKAHKRICNVYKQYGWLI